MKKLVLAVWIAFGLIVLVNYYFLPHSFWVNLPTIVGWLLLAIQVSYQHSEWIYLNTKRIWFSIVNPSCVWNMQVELSGKYDTCIFDKLDQGFQSLGFDNYKIMTVSNVRRIYKIYTLSVEVYLENDETMRLYIHDLQVSFRDSKEIIDQKIAKIFEKVQYIAKADSGHYGMQVSFKDYNPYYGFFIRRLNAKDVQRYNIQFKVEDNQVAVSDSSIEINSFSFSNLNELSKKYLALSDPH